MSDTHEHCAHGAHDHHAHAATAPQEAEPPGAQWTCPMHPQIVRDGPGACPICGMALEPMMPSAADAPNAELANMTRRFWVALALTTPLFGLEMGAHFFVFFSKSFFLFYLMLDQNGQIAIE